MKIAFKIFVCFTLMSMTCGSAEPTSPPEAKAGFVRPAENIDPTPEAQPFFFNPSNGFLEAAAKGVAQLVSSSFVTPPPRQANPDFMGSILRILGLDSSKLSAIALNAVIFLAQVIGSTLIKKSSVLKPGEEDDIAPPGSPLTWIFENSPSQARELVRAAQEKALPEKLIDQLRDSADIETDCIQLLLCKGAPIVWSMQRSLYKPPDPQWASMTPLQRMYTYFPTLEQLSSHSATCDIRFPSCKLRHSDKD